MQMISSFGSGVDKQRPFDCSLSTESERPQRVFYAVAVLGSVVAFICGGFLLQIYTHFDTIDLSSITLQQNDPRWVGVWWAGYLVLTVATLLVAPAFFGYPADPSIKKSTSNTSSDSEGRKDVARQRSGGGGLGGVVKTVKSLVTNLPFVFTALYGTFDYGLGKSFVAFGTKYIKQQFGLTATMASVVFGVVSVPGGAGGFLLGSILIKQLSLTTGQQLRAMFFLALLCLGSLLMFTVQCDTAPLADAPHTDLNGGDALKNTTCRSDCSCSMEWFQPVCGDDGLTYFSPCSAGCRTLLADTEYGNCSCVGGVSTNAGDVSSTAVDGVCAVTSCHTWRLVVFVIIFFILMITVFVCKIFQISTLLRVVHHSERPFAYAIGLMLQVVGGLPGPILFGFAIDRSCLLWEKKCDSSTGACLYYDNHEMAWLLLAVCAAYKIINSLCGLLSWRLYERQKGDLPQTRFEQTPTLDQTENGETELTCASREHTTANEMHDNQAFGISGTS